MSHSRYYNCCSTNHFQHKFHHCRIFSSWKPWGCPKSKVKSNIVNFVDRFKLRRLKKRDNYSQWFWKRSWISIYKTRFLTAFDFEGFPWDTYKWWYRILWPHLSFRVHFQQYRMDCTKYKLALCSFYQTWFSFLHDQHLEKPSNGVRSTCLISYWIAQAAVTGCSQNQIFYWGWKQNKTYGNGAQSRSP